jgi:probable DNA metabolism protein
MEIHKILIYDGSLLGLLSCIHELYAKKINAYRVHKSNEVIDDLFAERIVVSSNAQNADKVWSILGRKGGRLSQERVLMAFLSEELQLEHTIITYTKYILDGKQHRAMNNGSPIVRKMQELVEMVNLERLRIRSVLSFELLESELYYTSIDTKYNVLPLISYELSKRKANKPWIIFDNKRLYGMHYNLFELKEMGNSGLDSFDSLAVVKNDFIQKNRENEISPLSRASNAINGLLAYCALMD